MSVKGTKIPANLRLPLAGVTPAPTEQAGQELFPTGNFRFFRPVYRDKTPPATTRVQPGKRSRGISTTSSTSVSSTAT